MKKIDLVKMNSSMLKIMAENDIKSTDVSYIEVYDDFVELRKSLKFSAAIMELAEKYNKSERTISRMMAKLQEDLII